MDKSKTCAFTGHRPKLLPWGYNENDDRCISLKKEIEKHIVTAIIQGYRNFLCGMAIGVDTYTAEIVLELKKYFPDIELIPAIPFEHQYARWRKKDQERYFDILSQCTIKKVISPIYTNTCLMDRNKYMVDNASLLIAVYNGIGKSGTRNTIEYAKKMHMDIVIIGI